MKTKPKTHPCPGSYAASVGRVTTNWFKELSKKRITDARWEELRVLAVDWPTCAVGNACATVPRYASTGAPADLMLQLFGVQFLGHVGRHNAPAALATFAKIEARAAVVVRDTLAAMREGK